MYMYMHVYLYVYVDVDVYLYVCMYGCIHVYLYFVLSRGDGFAPTSMRISVASEQSIVVALRPLAIRDGIAAGRILTVVIHTGHTYKYIYIYIYIYIHR